MNSIVVAKFDEDMNWMSACEIEDWSLFSFDKSRDVYRPNTGHLENKGREANTYLYWIVNNYRYLSLGDEAVFCQGNPFDHDPDFIAHLSDDSVRHYGPVMTCPSSGAPHMGDAHLDEYCRVLGLPAQPLYSFVAGAQFRVRSEQIHAHPLAFYEALLAITRFNERSPWQIERLWMTIFP